MFFHRDPVRHMEINFDVSRPGELLLRLAYLPNAKKITSCKQNTAKPGSRTCHFPNGPASVAEIVNWNDRLGLSWGRGGAGRVQASIDLIVNNVLMAKGCVMPCPRRHKLSPPALR